MANTDVKPDTVQPLRPLEVCDRLRANLHYALAELQCVRHNQLNHAQQMNLRTQLDRAANVSAGIRWVVGDQHRTDPKGK